MPRTRWKDSPPPMRWCQAQEFSSIWGGPWAFARSPDPSNVRAQIEQSETRGGSSSRPWWFTARPAHALRARASHFVASPRHEVRRGRQEYQAVVTINKGGKTINVVSFLEPFKGSKVINLYATNDACGTCLPSPAFGLRCVARGLCERRIRQQRRRRSVGRVWRLVWQRRQRRTHR